MSHERRRPHAPPIDQARAPAPAHDAGAAHFAIPPALVARYSSPGAGAPLPPPVRARLERAFAADFSTVRVHEDELAAALGARAFAAGEHLHFAQGRYDPDGTAGLELLGHELAHVVQQREGRVAIRERRGGLPVNGDASLEHEADELGARAARGEVVRAHPAPSHAAPADGPIQGVFTRDDAPLSDEEARAIAGELSRRYEAEFKHRCESGSYDLGVWMAGKLGPFRRDQQVLVGGRRGIVVGIHDGSTEEAGAYHYSVYMPDLNDHEIFPAAALQLHPAPPDHTTIDEIDAYQRRISHVYDPELQCTLFVWQHFELREPQTPAALAGTSVVARYQHERPEFVERERAALAAGRTRTQPTAQHAAVDEGGEGRAPDDGGDGDAVATAMQIEADAELAAEMQDVELATFEDLFGGDLALGDAPSSAHAKPRKPTAAELSRRQHALQLVGGHVLGDDGLSIPLRELFAHTDWSAVPVVHEAQRMFLVDPDRDRSVDALRGYQQQNFAVINQLLRGDEDKLLAALLDTERGMRTIWHSALGRQGVVPGFEKKEELTKYLREHFGVFVTHLVREVALIVAALQDRPLTDSKMLWRRLDLDETVLKQLRECRDRDEPWCEPAFVSTSRTAEGAAKGNRELANTEFRYRTFHSGRVLPDVTGGEGEVLFPPGCRFTIHELKMEGELHVVELSEIKDAAHAHDDGEPLIRDDAFEPATATRQKKDKEKEKEKETETPETKEEDEESEEEAAAGVEARVPNNTLVTVTKNDRKARCVVVKYDEKKGRYHVKPREAKAVECLDLNFTFPRVNGKSNVRLMARDDFTVDRRQSLQPRVVMHRPPGRAPARDLLDLARYYSSGALTVADDPTLTGPVMTPGGKVDTDVFLASALRRGVDVTPRPHTRGSGNTAIHGLDTFGLLFALDHVAGVDETHLLPAITRKRRRENDPAAANPRPNKRLALADLAGQRPDALCGFRDDYVFRQTGLGEGESRERQLDAMEIALSREQLADRTQQGPRMHLPARRHPALRRLGPPPTRRHLRARRPSPFAEKVALAMARYRTEQLRARLRRMEVATARDYKPGREKLHTEAGAVHTDSWRSEVENAILGIERLLTATMGRRWRELVDELGREQRADETEERPAARDTAEEDDAALASLASFLGPELRKIVMLALNRTSCGNGTQSGYGYGCAGELTHVLTDVWALIEQYFGTRMASLLRELGVLQFELSVPASYKETAEGKLEPMVSAGFDVRMHSSYDFASDLLHPPKQNQLKLMAKIEAARTGARDQRRKQALGGEAARADGNRDQRRTVPDNARAAIARERAAVQVELVAQLKAVIDLQPGPTERRQDAARAIVRQTLQDVRRRYGALLEELVGYGLRGSATALGTFTDELRSSFAQFAAREPTLGSTVQDWVAMTLSEVQSLFTEALEYLLDVWPAYDLERS